MGRSCRANRVLGLVWLVWAALPSAAPGQSVFGGRASTAVVAPVSLVAADLNGDGAPDAVVIGEAEIGVFLGEGEGGFTRTQSIPAGGAGALLADVTGDGRDDLIVGAGTGCSISIYPHLEGALFGPAIPTPAGCGPASVVTADLNKDGVTDIITANRVDQTVALLFGLPGGGFSAPALLSTPVSDKPDALDVADVDGDGSVDLVVGGPDSVTIRWGNGDGTFTAPLALFAGSPLASVKVANADMNEQPDIFALESSAGRVVVWKQFLSRRFLPATSLASGFRPDRAIVADLDGDGDTDVATLHPFTVFQNSPDIKFAPEGFIPLKGGEVRVFLNESGAFVDSGRFYAGPWPRAATATDVDGDGVADLLVVTRSLRTPSTPFVTDPGAPGAPLADEDEEAPGSLVVARGVGGGDFSAPRRVVAFKASSIRVLDIDGDGDPDLVQGRDFGFFVRLNSGDGLFGTLLGVVSVPGLSSREQSFDFGLIDGDQKLDLVAATSTGMKVCLGNGAGMFADPFPVDNGAFRAVAVADVNGDQRTDIFGGEPRLNLPDQLVILRGDGAGAFTRAAQIEAPEGPFKILAGDFNGDGVPDAAMTCTTANALFVVLLNDSFQVLGSQTIPLGGEGRGLRSGDVDGDGDLDLVVAVAGPGFGAAVLRNDGSGVFTLDSTLGAVGSASDLELCDVTFDGLPDIMLADSETDTIHLFLNAGAGVFVPLGAFITGDFPTSLACADANGDGRIDLIAGTQNPMVDNLLAQTFSSVMTHFNRMIGPGLVGDLTGEGDVGPADLAVLLSQFGPCPPAAAPCPADFNHDGAVNGVDIAVLLNNFQ